MTEIEKAVEAGYEEWYAEHFPKAYRGFLNATIPFPHRPNKSTRQICELVIRFVAASVAAEMDETIVWAVEKTRCGPERESLFWAPALLRDRAGIGGE